MGEILKFNLSDMMEDGRLPDRHVIPNAAPHVATGEDIVKVVLADISKSSKFSQDMRISFKMKSGWEGYIRVWLFPDLYYGKPFDRKTDFSEIYLVEKDPSFLRWKSIYYRDTTNDDYQPSYEIYLNTRDMWDRHCSHYSGIWSVSWVEFLRKKQI